MKVTVSVASTDAQRQEAFALLYQIYLSAFMVDLKRLKRLFPLNFRSVVLLVKDETGRLLGTASLIYPRRSLFPTEYLFGATIRQDGAHLPLRQSIEVGRLAQVEDAPKGLVTRAIMLAVATYLKKEGLAGWVATVQPMMSRIIHSKGVESMLFEKYIEEKNAAKALIVKRYKGDKIVSFWAPAESTISSFERLASDDIVVEI